jgi:hypothetical protein
LESDRAVTRKLITGLALAAALLAPAAAAPASGGGDGDLRLALGYDGRLLIKVLDIEVEARADRTDFGVDAQLTSSGILALIKHIHQVARSQGRIIEGQPHPEDFETQNLGGKTRRKIHTVWKAGEVDTNADPAFANLGDPPPNPQQKRSAADPLTQLMRVTLDGSRERTCSRSYLFFDGKQLYALDFGPPADLPLGARETGLGLVSGFRCDVRYREVAGFSKTSGDKRNQGLNRPIQLDFARLGADGPLLITSLRAQTPLGWASIDLVRLQASGRPPSPA